MRTFIIEVEKGLNWDKGYINATGNVVEDISDAMVYEDEDEASDDAALFNMEFGENGKIYARVK